jgi:hypothetical protein
VDFLSPRSYDSYQSAKLSDQVRPYPKNIWTEDYLTCSSESGEDEEPPKLEVLGRSHSTRQQILMGRSEAEGSSCESLPLYDLREPDKVEQNHLRASVLGCVLSPSIGSPKSVASVWPWGEISMILG